VNFLSVQFALFLALSVPAFCLCPGRHRALFLLLLSYLFCLLWSPAATLGLLAATVFAYFVGLATEKEQGGDPPGGPRRRYVALGVSALVIYLSLFKVIAPLRGLLEKAGIGPPGLVSFLTAHAVLPLGISYYTFKLISYLIDIHWGNQKAERSFINFAAYTAFFPQIVAGPIQRGGEFLPQIQSPATTPEMMRRGLRRLLFGCFKKAVIADNLAAFIGASYPHQQAPEFSTLLAFYLFPLQMLADFSGLTDIAIGTGLLFGVESPENFDRPFVATSISQYWRRWHMSLTRWLNDYLFLPLRMATRGAGKWGLSFSLIANMVVIGVWHRVSWTFVVFGLLHGIFLVVDTLTSRSRSRFFSEHPTWDRAADLVGPVFTYHLVALAMVFVLAESVPQALAVLTHLGARPADRFGLVEHETMYGLAGLGAWIVFEVLSARTSARPLVTPVWVRWPFYYFVIWTIVKYGHNAENFIYYKF
jgi:alginate O-acetyltransferase complex protein AlgI